MNFVLDNSVAMCWLFASNRSADVAYSRTVLDALRTMQALVPALWALEAANVIVKAERQGLLTEARSRTFLGLLGRLNIVEDHVAAGHVLGETLNLARRYKLSSYVAAHLELAMRAGIPLATLDADLVAAAQAAGVPLFAGLA